MAITAAFSIYTYMTMPKPQNQSPQSPNNDLASRQNQIRLNGRIPDIYGTLLSYPDLISVTYTFYNEDGIEVERSLLCIGRGYYQIHNMKDAETEVSDIPGTSISVYDPFTDITGTPIYKNGRTFTDTPMAVAISDSITGQVLDAPNRQQLESTDVYFTADGYIRLKSWSFVDEFQPNDKIMIRGASIGSKDFIFAGAIILKTNNTIVFESAEDILNLSYQNLSLNGALVGFDSVTDQIVSIGENSATVQDSKIIYRDFSGIYTITNITKSTLTNGFQYTVALNAPNMKNPSWSFLTEDTSINSGLQLVNNDDAIYLDDTYTVEAVGSNYIKLVDPVAVNVEWAQLTHLPNQSTESIELDITLDKLDPDASWVGWHNIFMDGAEFAYFNIHFPNGLYRQNSKGGTSTAWTTGLIQYQYIDADGTAIGQIYEVELGFTDQTRVPFGSTKIIELAARGSIR
ncbi:phage tail protein, partial [Acinetobacter sichuanensis]